MSPQTISHVRFKWKVLPWEEPKNIKAIWFISYKHNIEFCFEISSDVVVPPSILYKPPIKSQVFNNKKLILIKDNVLVSYLEFLIQKMDVSGAKGQAIILGDVSVSVGSETLTLRVYTLLSFWRDYLVKKRFS